MEFAKIYDAKINEELKKYEKLQWEMYYRTLLPERMQQFEQEYTGTPEDKEQAMKQHEAELMAKHAGRIQRLLNQKRERLTVECLGELIDRLETAQHEADRKDNEFNPEDYEELPVDETSSCEDEAPTLASEIIADQKNEIEKLKIELQEAERNRDFWHSHAINQTRKLDAINFVTQLYGEKTINLLYGVAKSSFQSQEKEKLENEQEVSE
jgi:hypothetical protein